MTEQENPACPPRDFFALPLALHSDIAALQHGQQLFYRHHGHEFLWMSTDQEGIHSGRRRYLVACRACDELIHPATMGAPVLAENHVEKSHWVVGAKRWK